MVDKDQYQHTKSNLSRQYMTCQDVIQTKKETQRYDKLHLSFKLNVSDIAYKIIWPYLIQCQLSVKFCILMVVRKPN